LDTQGGAAARIQAKISNPVTHHVRSRKNSSQNQQSFHTSCAQPQEYKPKSAILSHIMCAAARIQAKLLQLIL
jgi:hypothetical protein